MENDYLLDANITNMETTSPPPSPRDQSPNSFSRDLIGRLGIISQGTETVINETQNAFYLVSLLFIAMLASVSFPSCFVTFYSSGRSLLPFLKS